MLFYLVWALTSVVAVSVPADPAVAGTPQRLEDRNWSIDLEVLIQPVPTARLQAQRWGLVMQQIGLSPRFRPPRPGEQSGLENVTSNGARIVRVIGSLTRNGRLQIDGKNYAETDVEKLKAKIAEIARYGAEGPPSESPTFGLTQMQYETIVALMSDPVDGPVSLRSPVTAVDGIGLPRNCRLKFTPAARSQLSGLQDPGTLPEADFGEISKGSALAIALAQFGLGFRPLASPTGGYDIEVDVGGEADQLWPVGWRTKDPINRALPEMFKSVEVSLEDTEITALIGVMSEQMKVPHFYSSRALADGNVDVTELVYNRRLDRLSMARLMNLVGDQFGLGLDVRVAENGQFFLWVTTREEHLAFRSRFAHVIPGK